MSLKAFHFAFICISILLATYLGGWCLQLNSDQASPQYLALGIGSLTAAAGLVAYLAWFLKKSKNIGFLVGLFAVATAFISNNAMACSVCFGNVNHPMVKAANAGVWFLMVVISGVLVGFASLFLYWGARARRIESSL